MMLQQIYGGFRLLLTALFVSFLSRFISQAQSPGQIQRVLTGDSLVFAADFTVNPNGGYFFCGQGSSSLSAGTRSVLIGGMDDDLELQWSRSFIPGGLGGRGIEIKRNSKGELIVFGSYAPVGNSNTDFFLWKTDTLGNILNTAAYGGPEDESGTSFKETSDGGFILAGITDGFTSGAANDLYLVKTDSNLALEWTRLLGFFNESDLAGEVIQTSDNGYALIGQCSPNGNGSEMCMVRLDEQGDTLWSQRYGGPASCYGQSVLELADGGFLLGGSVFASPFASKDFLLVRTDSLGTVIWSKTYGGLGNEEIEKILPIPGSGWLLAGRGGNQNSEDAYFMVQVDSIGDAKQVRAYGQSGLASFLESAIVTPEGEFLLSGYSWDFSSAPITSYLVKVDSFLNAGICNQVSVGALVDTIALQVSSGIGIGSGGIQGQMVWVEDSIMVDDLPLCELVAVAEPLDPQIRVFPNPVMDVVKIDFQGRVESGTLRLYDMSGVKLKERRFLEEDRLEIEVGNLPIGLYLIEIVRGERVYRAKVLVID